MDSTIIEFRINGNAWTGFADFIKQLIESRASHAVCELGGGANPLLPLEFVQANRLDYVILDISVDELAKAPDGYRTRVQDVTLPLAGETGAYDFVFSKMLAEHVGNAEMFHRNICALLKPGGIAVHFFPTLYAPPFIFNRLMPERWTGWMLNRIQRGRESGGRMGKFPAYYQWCRGPTRTQMARLESMGFRIVKYIGYFGHPGYYEKVPALKRLHLSLAAWLQRHPSPWLTSFCYVVLEKK